MCTVTFVPSGTSFFFTSSRDEKADRPRADLPKICEANNHRLIYPKDPQGGGSWIAVHDSGNVVVLLNGAIKAHQPAPPYLRSRGLVLLDLIAAESPIDAFDAMNLQGIEPFTAIIFDDRKLYSGRWDAQMKWQESHSMQQPQIWSSATLYDARSVKKREQWFKDWASKNPYPGTLDIIHFHQKGGDGDVFNDIMMNRDNQLLTSSISSVRVSPDQADLRYIDLINALSSESHLPLLKPNFIAT